MTPHWYAIRTLTGKEDAGRKDLKALGIEAVVPMQTTLTKPMKKRKAAKVRRPLLRGYVLARVPSEMWPQVRAAKHVIGWVANSTGPLAIRSEREVQSLIERERLGEFEHDGIEGRLSRGDVLEVLFGPFSGWSVLFIAAQGSTIHAEVEMLGAPRKVKLSPQDVRLSR